MPKATQWVAVGFGNADVLIQREVELADPGPGEVLVEVWASGMNPADYKHFGTGQDPKILPLTVGYEAAGVIAAIGPDTHIASGGGAVGDAVVVFQVLSGYSSALLVPAADVFEKPQNLSFAEASNLLLTGTTAAELLATANIAEGDTVLVHGGAGAVGMSVLQQGRVIGARMIGTARPDNFDLIRRFGATAVEYGPGLADRVRELAPDGLTAALDTVGSDEAVDVSLALLEDPSRLVSIAAFSRAKDGVKLLGANNPSSGAFRANARSRILDLAAAGDIEVVLAATYAFKNARDAVKALAGRHPAGKLALIRD
jgi:NADPH2:quinone reductase